MGLTVVFMVVAEDEIVENVGGEAVFCLSSVFFAVFQKISAENCTSTSISLDHALVIPLTFRTYKLFHTKCETHT